MKRLGVGLILFLLFSMVVTPAREEFLTRGAYICTEQVQRPGYFKEGFITERIADATGILFAYYLEVTSGPAGIAARVTVGSSARYAVKRALQWVPASAACLTWEHSSSMVGNQYQS